MSKGHNPNEDTMRAQAFAKTLLEALPANMAKMKVLDRHRVQILARDGTPFNITVHKVKDRISKYN